MAVTPRHHLVPQFLLKSFADASGLLDMTPRADIDRSPIRISVNNACNEAGFYRIDSDDVEPDYREGHDPEVIEQHLSVFEDRAKHALNTVLNTEPPWDNDTRYHLVNFVALESVRGWRFRRYLNEIGTSAMRAYLRSDPGRLRDMAVGLLESDGAPVTEAAITATIEEIAGMSGPRMVSSQPNAIQMGMEMAFGPLAEMLWVRALRVLHFDGETTLATSDSPVVTWAPGDTSRTVTFQAAAAVALPVSPRRALWFARRGVDGHVDATKVRGRQINFAIADAAERWIFAQPGTTPLKGLSVPAEPATWVSDGTTFLR